MQPIGRSAHHDMRETDGSLRQTGGLVLPRLLRKPARQVRRLLNGGFHVSRKGMVLSALAFSVLAGTAGYLGQSSEGAVMARLAPGLGIAITAFDISGNREVSEVEIARLASAGKNTSILDFNVDKARNALKEHPWISDARVSRVYPDRLAVEIAERKPFALWQDANGLQIIDSEGNVLAAYDGRANSLPLLVGAGAEREAAEFVETMNRYPSIASRAKAYVRVGERRWDLEFDDGVTVMLPETDVAAALERLDAMDREQELFARDIRHVDMRVAGRMVVRLSPDARKLIEETRKEQLKLLASSKKERNT